MPMADSEVSLLDMHFNALCFKEESSCFPMSDSNKELSSGEVAERRHVCEGNALSLGEEGNWEHRNSVMRKYDAETLQLLRISIPSEAEKRKWEEIQQQAGDVLLEVQQLACQDNENSKQFRRYDRGARTGVNAESSGLGGEDSSWAYCRDAVLPMGMQGSQMDQGGKRKNKRRTKQTAAASEIEYVEGFPEELENQELAPVAFDEACVGDNSIIFDDDSDDEDEPDGLLRPAFAVEGEPHFESGPPQDGMEFLRRVRWEAMHYPKVKVAKVRPAEVAEQSKYMPEIAAVPPCPPELLPHPEWEGQLLSSFSELRLWLSGADFCSAQAYPGLPSSTVLLPKLTDVAAWHLFCFGRNGGGRGAGIDGQETTASSEEVKLLEGRTGEPLEEDSEGVDVAVNYGAAKSEGQGGRGSVEQEGACEALAIEDAGLPMVEEEGLGVEEEGLRDGIEGNKEDNGRSTFLVEFGCSSENPVTCDVKHEGKSGAIADVEEREESLLEGEVCGGSREVDGRHGPDVVGGSMELVGMENVGANGSCGGGSGEGVDAGEETASSSVAAAAAGLDGWDGTYEGHVWRAADGRENWVADSCLLDSFEGVLWHGVEMCRTWDRGAVGAASADTDAEEKMDDAVTCFLGGEVVHTHVVPDGQKGVEGRASEAGEKGEARPVGEAMGEARPVGVARPVGAVVAVVPPVVEESEEAARFEGEVQECGVREVGGGADGGEVADFDREVRECTTRAVKVEEGVVGKVTEGKVDVGSGEKEAAMKGAEVEKVAENVELDEGSGRLEVLEGVGDGNLEGILAGASGEIVAEGHMGSGKAEVGEDVESLEVEEGATQDEGVPAGEALEASEERKRIYKSNPPLMGVILRLDECSRAALIRRHASWLQSVAHLSKERAQWIYALAAVVDKPLDADTSAAFRAIWRRCSVLRARKDAQAPLDEELHMLHALVTVAGKYFGQAEDG